MNFSIGKSLEIKETAYAILKNFEWISNDTNSNYKRKTLPTSCNAGFYISANLVLISWKTCRL